MDGRRFDDLARMLAARASRRAALRALSGGVAALLGLGFNRAAAGCVPIRSKCTAKDRCCHGGKCAQGKCDCHPRCRAVEVCAGNNTCCPKTNVCRNLDNPLRGKCCDPTETCVKGKCCAREKACRNPNNGDICCPGTELCFDGQVCCEPCGGDCCAQKGVGYVCCKDTCQPPCPAGKVLNPVTCACDCAPVARLAAADAGATLCCPDGQEECNDLFRGKVCCGACYTGRFHCPGEDPSGWCTGTFCCKCADGSPNCTPTVCPDPYNPGFDTCCSV